jgi:hypothetical protein
MLWVRISIRARCTTLRDKVCQWLETGWWFSLGPPVSSTNKTDCHDITEIWLKVALNTIKQKSLLVHSNVVWCIFMSFGIYNQYLFKILYTYILVTYTNRKRKTWNIRDKIKLRKIRFKKMLFNNDIKLISHYKCM